MTLFHLAIVTTDLEAARNFYVECLGCTVGRSTPSWVDFDFFGHQLSVHLGPAVRDLGAVGLDGRSVPLPHFGVVLEWSAWHRLVARLQALKVPFVIEPHIRFVGLDAEQATAFIRDPGGNAIEFKAFQKPEFLFAG